MRLLIVVSLLSLFFAWSREAFAAPPVADSNWGACRVSEPPPLPFSDYDVSDDELEIVSGKVEFKLEGDAKFSNEITLRSGNRILRADGAKYDATAGIFSVDGAVEFRDPETTVVADNAAFDRKTETVEFDSAEFKLWAVPARGEAEHVLVEKAGKLRLTGVAYTSCPAGKDDWMLRASKIEVDQNTGVGTARHARLRFKGVPILYVPYFTYPVSNQRKTGFLIPDVGNNDRRGFEVSTPIYWNIAPQYDSTITPHYMSKRGLQLNADFRYLASHTNGKLTGEFLNDDDVTKQDRWLYAWFNQTNFLSSWRGTVDVIGVSDDNYFEDLASNLASTSQPNLRRHFDLEYSNKAWSALIRFEDYQNLDPSITPVDEPYRMLPHTALRGFTPNGLLGMSYLLDAGATYFDRGVGVTGVRGRIAPEIGLPISAGFVDMEPAIAVDYTRYQLNHTLPGQPDNPDIFVPIASFDARSVFERVTNRRQWLQTLEPRLLYTYIPFRDQNDLPVFDTIVPDLNTVQLFRKNRFVGHDRIGDTNQLAFGLTTRLITSADGDEFLRATIGGIRYFSSRKVTLPGGVPSNNNSSDLFTELGTKIYDNWRMKLVYQWDSDASETERAEARLLYQNKENKMANIAYRFRKSSFEDIDASVAWPLSGRWNVVGRYKYSIRDKENLESLVGLEYSTCCWSVQANWRRYLASRTGELDTSITLQLNLNGLSNSDSAAEGLLDRGILGYD